MPLNPNHGAVSHSSRGFAPHHPGLIGRDCPFGASPSRRGIGIPVLAFIVLFALLASSLTFILVGDLGSDRPSREPLSGRGSSTGTAIDDIEFSYNASTYETQWPVEWWIKRFIGVKNNGSVNVTIDFNATLLETGAEISPFPQPFHLYLDPGEQQTLIYMLDPSACGLTDPDLRVAQDITRTLRFTLWLQGNESASRDIVLVNLIHVVPLSWCESNPNAGISGHIYGPTGKPLDAVRVELSGSNIAFSTYTDGNGYYGIPFYAHRNIMTDEVKGYDLEVKETGYEAFLKALWPTPGASITQDIVLGKRTETVNISLMSRTETGMTIYRGAVTDDERYVVFSHGHAEINLTDDEIENRSSVMMFDTADGSMLWRWHAYGEVWGVDVSDDGDFVVATVIQPSPVGYAVLLDHNGTELWNTTSMGDLGSREIKISHNATCVAWGVGDGYLYLLNRSDRKVLWTRFLEGQIRQIEFAHNDSVVYAGSGDGYLYAVNTSNGDIMWRTNIEAWPYSTGGMKLAEDDSLIMTASKVGNYSLIDVSTGERLWSLDSMGGAHYGDISPNKDFVLGGSGGIYGTCIIDMDGTLRWFQEGSGSGSIFPDGKLVAVGQDWGLDVINLNGTVLANYSEDFSWTGRPVTTSFVYVFKDQTKIIVGHGSGAAFFWNVSYDRIPFGNDSVAPSTSDDYDGSWHPSDFTINLTASDSGSGVLATYYKVNDGPVMNVSVDGQPLIHTEGANNKLEYWSVDNASNEEWPHHVLTGIKEDVTDPNANAGPDQGVLLGDVCWLDGAGSSDNLGIANYTWTFTYESTEQNIYGRNPQFVFMTEGTYNITLTVKDNAGRTDIDIVEITVSSVIPEIPSVALSALSVALLVALIGKVTVFRKR